MKTIAIIGMGPRGASLLERLITHLIERNACQEVHLCLFEKDQEPGSGCHHTRLPADLLTNTVAGQVTMYFGQELEDYGPVHAGPSLHNWHQREQNPNVSATDYLPRRELGRYLRDFYVRQIERMRHCGISHEQIKAEVTQVVSNGEIVHIKTEANIHEVCQVVLCTGHEDGTNSRGNLDDTYLSPERLDSIAGGARVAVQGMGLTAFDFISRLTSGRGGTFEETQDGKLRYKPCNEEPTIYLYSRNGVFHAGRAYNPAPDFVYVPKYFRKDTIESMRGNGGSLDFARDIYPLLAKELQHIYSERTGGEVLDLELFLNPERKLRRHSRRDYINSFCSYLRWDIEQCTLGKMRSAHKFCQDAIRDMRDQFRAAIEHRGLNDESYLHFISHWNPRLLKICVGPPYQRLRELQALIEAEVCSVEFALNPQLWKEDGKRLLTCKYGNSYHQTKVAYALNASIASMNIGQSGSKLAKFLSVRYRPFCVNGWNCGGLEITKDYEVMRSDGEIQHNIHALGIPAEGAKYFTLVLGRPDIQSTFLLDSNRLATVLLDKLGLSQR